MLHIIAGSRTAGQNQPLLALDKAQGGQFHDLSLIDAGLELEVKVRQHFALGQFGLADAPFYASFDQRDSLDIQKTFDDGSGGKVLLCRKGQGFIQGPFHPAELQGLEVLADVVHGLVHGKTPLKARCMLQADAV